MFFAPILMPIAEAAVAGIALAITERLNGK